MRVPSKAPLLLLPWPLPAFLPELAARHYKANWGTFTAAAAASAGRPKRARVCVCLPGPGECALQEVLAAPNVPSPAHLVNPTNDRSAIVPSMC